MPEALKTARRLNKTELEALINRYLWLPAQDLEGLEGLPAVEQYFISILLRGLKTGDYGPFEWIAQRLIGKVKDQVELTTPTPFIVHNLEGGEVVMGVKPKAEG